MHVRLSTDDAWDVQADVLAVPIVGDPDFDGPLGGLDGRLDGTLRAMASLGEVRAKEHVTALLPGGATGARWVVAIGAGQADRLDRRVVHDLGAAVVRRLAGRSISTVAVWMTPLVDAAGLDAAVAAEAMARGLVDGMYDPRSIYLDDLDDLPPTIDGATLVGCGPDGTDAAEAARRGVIVAEGSTLARTLSNRAANDVSPAILADEARALAERHDLWIDVIDEKRAAELGMGMFLAVGRGSDNPPRMIVMRSGAEGGRDALGRHLAIVGKGVCFDSGGISIKPADRMEEMKMDKIGACTVIAAIATVARIAPGTPLLAVAPAVENLPGPHSTRPGDIVRALNGKMVDVINTDAEGRLILGDALTYAERLGATHLVDVATLTGAVHRAFGELVTGAFGTPQAWYDDVVSAGDRVGERYWQIPLVEDYVAGLESWYGDLQNTGTPDGGLVKSGLFIREFTTVPWVHLDIGGTGYFRKAKPFAPRGATGVTHATLVELALAGARPA
jgi:leucyl aminopeptidase